MFKNKLLFIRADGSHVIGLGHIYRIKTLAKSLISMGGRVVILTLENPISVIKLQDSEAEIYTYQEGHYHEVFLKLVKTLQLDLLIYDCLAISEEEIAMVKQIKPHLKILTFDDVGDGLKNADVVINSFAFHWNLYNPSEVITKLFEGPKYMIMQSEIDNYINQKKYITDQVNSIFIAFGGTDTHFVTERVLAAINGIDIPLNIKINLGPGSQSTPNLMQYAKESCHRVKILYATPNLFQEFCQSDLVLCAGGNMLYELAALGLPAIAIATEKHEIYNIDYWSNVGTIVALSWEKDLQPEQIRNTVSQLIYDKPQREKMSKLGKEMVDTQGLARVLKIINDLLV
jgi:spore coat polysaccharide biosynthesis predicted glycosyltransferase SpsG